MREVISLHLGQAGVQLGTTCWELYCQEHGLDAAGDPLCLPSADSLASRKAKECGDVRTSKSGVFSEGFNSFFQQMSSGNYSPLAMLIDLEPSVVDQVRTGQFRKLYSPCNLVTGTEDAANNFARGACSVGKAMLPVAMDPLRKMAETCDRLQGFMTFHSFGGGTGSGFNAILAEELTNEYPKNSKLEISIFPSPTMSTSVVEPYNTVLSTNSTLDLNDCVFLSDNEAMYRICQMCLDIDNPTYTDLNSILAQTASSITTSLRFKGSLNADFIDFQTNLVPYPRIHFPIMSYAPIVSSKKMSHEKMSVADLTNQAFSASNRLIRCPNEEGLYMSCCLLYRGDIVPKDVNSAIALTKEKKSVRFVPWSPTGFKVGINSHVPGNVVSSEMSPVSRAVCMLCNTTAIREAWMSLNLKYHIMLEKKAFVHWYKREGMDTDQFLLASENLLALEQDYDLMNNEI